MEKMNNFEKHEVFNKQGELMIVNWLVETDGKFIISTLPISLVYFFCRKLFPTYPDICNLDNEQTTFCFEEFNRYTEENLELLLEKLPSNLYNIAHASPETIAFSAFERWNPPIHTSVIDADSSNLDFSYWEEDIYAFTELCLPWLTAVNYQNDMEFISRSTFEQKLQNQEQIDYYLDHYKLLSASNVVFLAMYERHANFFMPVKDNRPLFIFVEHKPMDQNEAA